MIITQQITMLKESTNRINLTVELSSQVQLSRNLLRQLSKYVYFN